MSAAPVTTTEEGIIMLNQQTLEQLRTLKLTGMLDALDQQQAQ